MQQRTEPVIGTPAPQHQAQSSTAATTPQAMSPILKLVQSPWVRRLPVAVIAVVLVTALLSGWLQWMSLETIINSHDRFYSFIAAHRALAIAIYIITYTTVVSLSLPSAGFLTMAGGLYFGWLTGGFAAATAACIGAFVLFSITRLAAHGTGPATLSPRFAKLQSGFQSNALNYLIFLRLIPAVPFCVVNIVPALLGMPLKTFMLGTALGMLPATFTFSSLGAGLNGTFAAAKAEQAACLALHAAAQCPVQVHLASLLTPETKIGLTMLALLSLLPPAVKYWKHRNGR